MFSKSTTKNILNTFFYQIFSKGIGYIKYILFAFLFGASMQMDTYNMALTILDVSMFVFGHVFSVVGVPKLVEARQKSLKSFKKLSASIFSFSIILAVVIIPLQYILFDMLISILAPGFTLEKQLATYELFKYFLPMSIVYLPYFALISFFRALNLFNISNFLDFLIALFSVLYLLLFMNSGIFIIPSSLSVAYVIVVFIALYFAYRIKIIGFFGNVYTTTMKVIYRNILQLSLWFFVLQLYRVVDKGFASLLEDGMISAFIYASILISSIGFIFDFAYVYLTKFSEKNNKATLFSLAIKLYLFLSFPIIIFLVAYSQELISFIYGNGKFDTQAIHITSSIILILSPLLFISLVNALFQSFYQSLQKYSYVITLTFIGVFINFCLNYLWIDYYGIQGIAFSSILSSAFILIINLLVIHFKEKIYLNFIDIIRSGFVYLVIAILSFVVTCFIGNIFIIQSLLYFIINVLILIIIKDEFIVRIFKLIRNR